MRVLRDHQGRAIRLTDERWSHIQEHPEMVGMAAAIEETLADPEVVVRSTSDPQVSLYHRYYQSTAVGEKYVCVVVKVRQHDAFIVTAYLTDRVRRGDVLWPKS